MYSRSLPYDTCMSYQSDLERSRRFGSGVYPPYPVSRSTRNYISNISVNSELRSISETRQGNSTLRNTAIPNIDGQNNSVIAQPSSSGMIPPLYSFNLENTLSNLNTLDPFKAFILEPKTSEVEDAIYNAIACKYLPLAVKETLLQWPSEESRNLLGMISPDVLPEDMQCLKKCFSVLKRVQYNNDEEPALGKDMSFLLHKYGAVALRRHVETYTECCRKVWRYYNPNYTKHPPDEQIFTRDAIHCYKVINHHIEKIIKSDDIWAGIVCHGLHLKNACGALGVCLIIDPNVKIPADSINETFESVYLNNTNNVSNSTYLNDFQITPCEGRDPPSVLTHIFNVICCDI